MYPQAPSQQLPYKSLPALDQKIDTGEKEHQEISESMDALYN